MPDYFATIIINFVCIILQLIITAVLIWSVKVKRGMTYVAIIISVCTIPVYCANMLRDIGYYEVYAVSSYVACCANTILMPMIWFFTRSQLETGFRFKPVHFFHFIPALVSLAVTIIYYYPLSYDEMVNDITRELSGQENMAHVVNDVIVFGQMFIYFSLSITLIRESRRLIMNNYSDSEYLKTKWVSNLVYFMAAMFFVVFVAYTIKPRTDSWMAPIMNVLITCYIVYNAINNPVTHLPSRDADSVYDNKNNGNIDDAKLKEYADKIAGYLELTKSFTDLDLSLRDVAKATGISDKNASMAINKYLGCSFFELINRMRITEAKRLLLLPESSLITIETIALTCGFRSRSSFYTAFSKFEKTSPSKWLKRQAISRALSGSPTSNL